MAIKITREKAGSYLATAADGMTYNVLKHDGLTWQDPAFWVIHLRDANGHRGTVTNRSGRTQRYRTLAEAKAAVVRLAEKKGQE